MRQNRLKEMVEEKEKLKMAAEVDQVHRARQKQRQNDFYREAMQDFYEKKQMKEEEIADRPNLLWADRQLMYRNARVEMEREQ